ncbi:MAG: HlyD family efflux transporter periplasmic adaptor subunit [Microscillaceae bacterium]|nr:HlyD family efflux transporter periplasmic adaptor subunit [Microscillaceae bacterium]
MRNLFCFTLFVFLFACSKQAEKPQLSTPPQKLENSLSRVVGIATIEPLGKILPLNAESNGIVSAIYAKENESYDEGEVLVQLENDIETAQIRQVESKIATQQAAVIAFRGTLASAKVRLENARINYERNQKMFEGNAITRQTLDDSKFNYENLLKELETAQANLVQQENKIGELQADLNYQKTVLTKKAIKAPTKGMVLAIDTKLGSNVKNETTIGEFAPEGALMAITEVDELYADRVKIGQKAFIRPQGSQKKLADGKIIFTSPYLKKKSLFSDQADNLEDRRVREVRVELSPNAQVLIGSRVECVIEFE